MNAEKIVDRVIRLERVVRTARMNEDEYMRPVEPDDLAEWLGGRAPAKKLPEPPKPMTHAGRLKVQGEEKNGKRGGDCLISGGEADPPADKPKVVTITDLIEWLDRRMTKIEGHLKITGESRPTDESLNMSRPI